MSRYSLYNATVNPVSNFFSPVLAPNFSSLAFGWSSNVDSPENFIQPCVSPFIPPESLLKGEGRCCQEGRGSTNTIVHREEASNKVFKIVLFLGLPQDLSS